ncbi:hypothetical protein PCS_00137 [Desulfocurvibacter africanus PCS]|uniref:Lipoprotein n=1 Tax=Desulfocurvibacter africanus PCS TaxID=1262666 RepID=M5PWU9_DESAF|nr:hypothetical protein [Desulfocurvibacter africanus]EMG38509.1 hypothetical protein PCS_00137 [Desulfocurvibacter africanus PCS]
MYKLLMVIIGISHIFAFGCTYNDAINTPSGYPEAVFYTSSLGEVQGRIAGNCGRMDMQLFEIGTNHVICGRGTKAVEALLSGMMEGLPGNSNPGGSESIKAQFFVYQSGQNVKATAYEWKEYQTNDGKTVQHRRDGILSRQDLQNFLISIGGLNP